ncbi:MAG TPA: UbiD family decarboxylase [Candidatus Methylomirabilis sp.]|nr:UbiD family decarboxylase [Candidatus Methylomirabilis sp.]
MASLRTFLDELESKAPDEIWRIHDEVEAGYDIAALVLELERRGERPVLWFDRVRGSRFPIVTNLFADRRRYAQALGVGPESLADEWVARGDRRVPPVLRATGPVQDVVLTGPDADLGVLPIFRHFSEDGGPYLTNGIVVAKDPDTGVRNASFHRMQVRGRTRLGTSLHSRRHLWDYQRRAERRGEALAVSVVVGAHPLFHFGAGLWKGPIDVDEYEVAGGFFGEPLEIVSGVTVPVEAPAEAEIVLEGHILSGVREPEGPFAEFTGYASERSTQHVLEVSAILHRRDAIYQDIVGGISAEHTTLLAVPQEARLLKVLRGNYPGVRAVSYPQSGTCRLHCYVSMKPSAEGQAKNVAFAALGEDLSLKLVVVVDDDVDVRQENEVLWAVATRMQADRDLCVIPNAMGAILDPSTRDGTTAKVIIDATQPIAGYPRRHTLPPDAIARAAQLLAGRSRV